MMVSKRGKKTKFPAKSPDESGMRPNV
jgi:hypothetical protein